MAGRVQKIYVKGKEHYIIELVDYFDYVKMKEKNLIDKDTFYYLNKEEVASLEQELSTIIVELARRK